MQPDHRARLTLVTSKLSLNFFLLAMRFRLFPSITGVYRKFDKDVIFSGYNVPKGTVVFADFYITGRNPNYFENPEEFQPERWLKKGEGHAYGSLPFSFGPRMCLGRRVAELELWVLVMKVSLMRINARFPLISSMKNSDNPFCR